MKDPYSGDLDSRDIEALKQLRPDLAKRLDLLSSLRAKRVQLEAARHSKTSSQDWVYFIHHILGWKPTQAALIHGYKDAITPDQKRVVLSVQKNRKTAVPAGHGVGKTKIASAIALAFLHGGEDRVVVTTAPNWALVEAQLWRQIRSSVHLSKIPLQGRLLETEIKIRDLWYAIGLSTDNSSAFQGFHGPGGTMIIFDEATGVREELWDAAESMVLGPNDRMLAIGNPTSVASRFYVVCQSPVWNVVHLDGRNHPNVVKSDSLIIPGAITKEYVEDSLEEYGGEESPVFRSRVAGLFPTGARDSLFTLDMIEDAMAWDEKNGKQIEMAGA